ncbi:MAG TPA: hypothetical protein VLT47_06095 [Anaeromyxobacteraceae bacterium]|nr:hypothetical protein [Anaeromyxobacteraceae bacterium]
MKTHAYAVHGDVLLSALAVEPPSDREWDDYLAAWARMRGGERRKVLVFTEKAGPTAEQRGQLAALLGGAAQRAAVVTPSAVGRLMVAAVAWANPAVRAFLPAQVGEAFDYLDVPHADRAELLAAARPLVAAVGAEVEVGRLVSPAGGEGGALTLSGPWPPPPRREPSRT